MDEMIFGNRLGVPSVKKRERSVVAEDIKHMLDQIDKILDIHAMLMREMAHPKFIVDSGAMSDEDFKDMKL